MWRLSSRMLIPNNTYCCWSGKICHTLVGTPVGGILRNAIPVLDRLPEIAKIVRSEAGRRRNNVKVAVKRAMEAGVSDRDRNADAICDALSGAIYSRFLITRRNPDRSFVRNLWREVALRGG